MKKQNTAFTFNFYLFTLYSSCLSAFVAEIRLAAAKPLAKTGQSKTINYAKQSQFLKKSNVYNPNFNNELQRKIENGHLVKTNPIKPNFNLQKLAGFILAGKQVI
jgi:hypothetical protein